MFGLSTVRAVLYGMLLALILGMGFTIKYQLGKIEDLTTELNAAKLSLASSKEIIAKMVGAEKVSEKIETFISQGQSFVAGEHKEIGDELNKEYQDYLLQTQREHICLTECGDFKPEGPVCELPTGYIPNPKIEKVKIDYIDNAWKNYCVANRTAEGCK